jgi:hypothetical protein
MRSVIVHLAEPCTEDDVADVLARAYEGQGHRQWVEYAEGDTCLTIEFYRDHLTEYEPAELEQLKSHFAGKTPLSVVADIGGRHDGTAQVKRFVQLLLAKFPGVATDDFTDHIWSRFEIEQNVLFDGLAFFDYRGFYERERLRPTDEG